MYGGAEASLGAALAGRRDEATCATKIWARLREEARAPVRRASSSGSAASRSSRSTTSWRWREHLAWLEAERGGGRIGRLGVTHYSPAAFGELAARAADATASTPSSCRTTRASGRASGASAARGELGVAVIVMRPFGDGALLAQSPRAEELSPLAEFGVETWPQALLKWVLSDERVDLAIPATRARSARRERGGR